MFHFLMLIFQEKNCKPWLMSPQKSGMLICERINESSFIIIQPVLMP